MLILWPKIPVKRDTQTKTIPLGCDFCLCGEEISPLFKCFFLVSGGISAYNAEPNNVQSQEGMDIGTTHSEYANDGVARAKIFKRNGC